MSINYDVKPNSHKYRKEQANKEKKIESVVSAGAKTKKKNELTKFAEFIEVDNIKDTLSSAAKKALSDVVMKGIDMMGDVFKNCIDIALYGEIQSHKKNRSVHKVSYDSYYRNPIDRSRHATTTRSMNVFDYDDVIFETRGDALTVLDAMQDIIDQYQFVSVSDLYELSEITTDNYMVNNYGWKDISSADVVRVRDGYMIKLPRAVPIN